MNQTHPDQTDGGWPNFIISAKFHNFVQFTISDIFHNPGIPEILGIPGVRAVSQFLRCFVLFVILECDYSNCSILISDVGAILCICFFLGSLSARDFLTNPHCWHHLQQNRGKTGKLLEVEEKLDLLASIGQRGWSVSNNSIKYAISGGK